MVIITKLDQIFLNIEDKGEKMSIKIKLGILNPKATKTTNYKQAIFLTKHSFDCGWYWGFGYIGNAGHHFHIDSLFHNENIKDVFTLTPLNQTDWNYLRDQFKKAYDLKYSKDQAKLKEQENILNDIWSYLTDTKKLKEIRI
jgi:hypothetical protein